MLSTHLTPYQSQYVAWLLSRRMNADSVDLLASTLVDAQIDLKPLKAVVAKGTATVDVLQLDRREALSAGLKTRRHLSNIVERALLGGAIAAPALMTELNNADDHGLLAWCLSDRGQAIRPFNDLQLQHPAVWRQCRKAI